MIDGRHEAMSTYLGTVSLNNSILIRPAGLSPIEMSKKTTGRPLVPAPGNDVELEDIMVLLLPTLS